MQPFKIASRHIGTGSPVFIIAEAGVNHNGDLSLAKQLIDVAVAAKADAVKFQTFKTENVVTPIAPKAAYQLVNTNAQESQFNMIKALELSFEAFHELHEYCRERNILFLSTPFDYESADFLDVLGVPLFKVPSGEITNLPFLKHIARKGKPLIVSTGMSSLGEVETAVNLIKETSDVPIILLHCVSNYPADPSDANLRAMLTMTNAFKLPVGFSDHTPGIEVSLAAVALEACVIEKHFTLDHSLTGPDHKASLEPSELQALVKGVRIVEQALGDGRKISCASEANTATVARRSLVAARDIHAGTILTQDLIAIKRPGTGLPSVMLPYVIGRVTRGNITAGTLLSMEMLQ